MERNTFQREIKRLTRCRNLLLLLVIILSSALFTILIAGPKDQERIVIVPTSNPHQDFWLENARCSKSYLEEMGLFLADALFTKTPVDTPIKNEVVLKHTHPARFHAIKRALAKEEKQLVQRGQVLSFHPTDFHADVSALKFFISGTQKAYLDKQKGKMAHQNKISYCLTFAIKRGQILLMNIHKTNKEKSQ